MKSLAPTRLPRPPAPTRLLASLAVTAMVVSGLGGCFLLPTLDREPRQEQTEEATEPAAGPRVGDCWSTNYSDLAEWASWEGAGPVDCDKDHQAITFLAEDLAEDIDQGWDREGATNELLISASDQCRAELKKEIGWTESEARLAYYFFVPTEDEWRDGLRAIRCDIAVTEIGSDYFDPDLEDLPADLADVTSDLESNPSAYQLCLIGDGTGPFEGEEAEVADCEGDYFWRYGGRIEFESELNDPYPAGDALFDFAIDECPTLGILDEESVYPYTPSPKGWDFGDRGVECWFSLLEAPATSL